MIMLSSRTRQSGYARIASASAPKTLDTRGRTALYGKLGLTLSEDRYYR